MRAVVQRVLEASVYVDNKKISEIQFGLLILLGVLQNDEEEDVDYLVRKTAGLRIFKDNKQNMNHSIQDIGGEILVVSQFTLCADTSRGNRPSFVNAAGPRLAENMYEKYCRKLQDINIAVEKGYFGAMMSVKLINDGPVTIILNSYKT